MAERSKTATLRRLLKSRELEFLMEAHNGLSARIVEEAGFKGIWASGLALSAQFGVRDCNEASWTQVVDMLEFMSDATNVPILLDGDTGYGDFNNVRRLVKKLEQRGIAGVCLEDKLFPKRNSLLPGERQPLADIAEFCGKLKAAKDSQADSDFVVVARVEALIANRGMDEALERAEAYRQAGATIVDRPQNRDAAPGFARRHGTRNLTIGIEFQIGRDLAPQSTEGGRGSRAHQLDEFIRADHEPALGIHLPDKAQRLAPFARGRIATVGISGCIRFDARARRDGRRRRIRIFDRTGIFVCCNSVGGNARSRRRIEVGDQHGRDIGAEAFDRDLAVRRRSAGPARRQRLAEESGTERRG